MLTEGLAGQNTASFESTTRPGFFCCLREGRLRLEQNRLNDPEFAKRCSYKMWSNRFFDGYVSFEAFDKSDQVKSISPSILMERGVGVH